MAGARGSTGVLVVLYVFRFLLILCGSLSSLMCVVSVLDVFVRGRPLTSSLIACTFVVFALAWDPIKFSLVGFGAAHHASMVASMRRAGVVACAVGACMSVVSVVAIGHGVLVALSPSDAEAQEAADTEAEAQSRSSVSQAIAALTAEHQALLASGMTTKAYAVTQQMHEIITGQTRMTASQDRSNTGQASVKGRSNAITTQETQEAAKNLPMCLLLGLLIEGVTCALAVACSALSESALTAHPSGLTVGQTSSTAHDLDLDRVLEEIRTGQTKLTRASIMMRVGCGSGKADRIIAAAKKAGLA